MTDIVKQSESDAYLQFKLRAESIYRQLAVPLMVVETKQRLYEAGCKEMQALLSTSTVYNSRAIAQLHTAYHRLKDELDVLLTETVFNVHDAFGYTITASVFNHLMVSLNAIQDQLESLNKLSYDIYQGEIEESAKDPTQSTPVKNRIEQLFL